jgi:hypothetical protein
MTHPDFRAELERLVNAIGAASDAADVMLLAHRAHDALGRARAALSAAPQQGPTIDDISELCDEFNLPLSEDEAGSTLCKAIRLWEMANAILTRYGAQAVPVAVAERLPGEGNCDDLISDWQVSATGTQLKVDDRLRAFATDAARWGAEQAAERLKGQWPTPITDRPPTEADGDYQGWVMILSDGVWRPWVWSQVVRAGWLHTPRWEPPAPPTLKEQPLKALGPCPEPRPLWDGDPGDPPCGVIGNAGEIEWWRLIRRALEADS